MGGLKIYTADFNGVRISKGVSVAEFKSWIVGTLGGTNHDYGRAVTQTSDGGFVVAGSQSSQSQGWEDALMVKYDNSLNMVTQKGLGGTSHNFYYSVIQTSDGGYVAVGYQNSQGQGNHDALIVKYDSNLNVVTQKGLGGSSTEYYYSVIQSSDGGYVAVGQQYSQGQGIQDALIVKYDSNLNLITQKGLGGSSSDAYQSVIQSSDGGLVAVGYQDSQGQGNYDALIVKYDSNLNVTAQKGLGGSNIDMFYSVIQSSDGGYVAVGNQGSEGQGIRDALIVKYDSDLNVTAQKGLGGTSNDFYYSVIQSSDGGYVAVGSQNSQAQGYHDALIVKYDSNLNVTAQKGLGGSGNDRYKSVVGADDGGFVAVGDQRSEDQGVSDVLITKLPSDFDLITGSLENHNGLVWTVPTLTETTPTLTETTPTLTVTTPTLTETTPTLTETTPTLVETRSEKQ